MEYSFGGKQYCANWRISWEGFQMEPFVKDGESSGLGRFIGLSGGKIVVNLTFADPGVVVETGQGFIVQLNTEHKTISIFKREEIPDGL
ncbi:MAG: hypothetical protein ACH0QD_13115 [Tepidibacillus sp.]